ncbi:unnamed protein product, partial [marine sediment metagenome]
LPEIYLDKIKDALLVANPGCYPTSIILGITPLLKYHFIEPEGIIIDSKSGASGAGRKLSLGLHFSECNENFKAYKVIGHNHIPEVEQELSSIYFGGDDIDVIIGPAIGGIIMAHVMARVLGPWVRAIFTERENGKMTLRRSFEIKEGEKVLVVEDVTTTGSSVREVIDIVNSRKGKVVGVGVLIDRCCMNWAH